MDALDLSWMSPAVRRAFDEGVRLYAEAVREGAVSQMQDGSQAMQRAAQIHIRSAGAADPAAGSDPSI